MDKKQLLEDADKLAHYCDCQHHGNCAPCRAASVLRRVAEGQPAMAVRNPEGEIVLVAQPRRLEFPVIIVESP